jgi:hypothetical protein
LARLAEAGKPLAAEFEELAASTSVDMLRKRYADIAACYRLLAKEREWLISAIESEQTPQSLQRPADR